MSSNPAIDANETMAKLLALENRTGYRMQQFNGQRKFWNPNWDKPTPPRGCEVFVGKIPRNLFEDELVPVFEKMGEIYELRLMMDFSGYNRGYAFVCFTTHEHAQLAISRLDNYEIRPGMRIGVCRSVDNCRLFVGGIPKNKTQHEIKLAMCEISEDVSDVIVYPGSELDEQNRGFAFVEYKTHRSAAMARRKLIPGRITLFGNEIVTDWAEPEVDANESLSRIKNVYVRNLKITTSEHTVFSAFNVLRPGAIEKVKKIEDKDYAFVHFLHREDALYAVQVMNGQKIDGQEVQVSLAKPPSNKHDTGNPLLPTLTHSSSINQSQAFGRINGLMMTRPGQASQIQNNPLQQYNSQPTSDYNNLIRAQTAAKLQQSLRSLPPPVLQSSTAVSRSIPSTIPGYVNSSQASGTASTIECICNGRQVVNPNELTPVSTLDHIAKIQCPVVYLDEISTRFNNGIRPIYELYCENSNGIARYVYRITFLGERYMPPTNQYSNDVSEARMIAAEYVIKQIDPWLKKKMSELVMSNVVKTQPPPSNARQPTSNAVALWGMANKPLPSLSNDFNGNNGFRASLPPPTSNGLLGTLSQSNNGLLSGIQVSASNGLLGTQPARSANGLLGNITLPSANSLCESQDASTNNLLAGSLLGNFTMPPSKFLNNTTSSSSKLVDSVWNQMKGSAGQQLSQSIGCSFTDSLTSSPGISDAIGLLQRRASSYNGLAPPCGGL
ncbi:uncharacterized protein LOC143471037 isoform X2 [Clavelina lepadiformis]|uniref:uncharacterized protein LOC143471037 isoform X2 n=1 Tax=Clavelina lepadiformis TaxID=159417 RepID=UPI0040437CFF